MFCGTRVTRLLVAGSWRSIQVSAWLGVNWLSTKFKVSLGFSILSWERGYSVGSAAAPVALSCWAVACRRLEGIKLEREAIVAVAVVEVVLLGKEEAVDPVLETVDREREEAMAKRGEEVRARLKLWERMRRAAIVWWWRSWAVGRPTWRVWYCTVLSAVLRASAPHKRVGAGAASQQTVDLPSGL